MGAEGVLSTHLMLSARDKAIEAVKDSKIRVKDQGSHGICPELVLPEHVFSDVRVAHQSSEAGWFPGQSIYYSSFHFLFRYPNITPIHVSSVLILGRCSRKRCAH